MQIIERSKAFKKDYKREIKGKYREILDSVLLPVLHDLVNERILDQRYKDHQLIGNWSGYRECHLKPDLLLIYKHTQNKIILLARLGSHAKIFN